MPGGNTNKFLHISNAIIQVWAIGINLFLAARDFHKHHYGAAAFGLGCAVFLVGLNIFLARARKRDAQRHAALMAEVHAEVQRRHAEMIRRTEESVMSPEIMEKSIKNLALVVQAVGAKNMGGNWYGPYSLKVEKRFFRLGHCQVIRCTKEGEAAEGTCIQPGGLPPAEVIATLLLLLKHDPELFEMWRNNHGTYYGA